MYIYIYMYVYTYKYTFELFDIIIYTILSKWESTQGNNYVYTRLLMLCYKYDMEKANGNNINNRYNIGKWLNKTKLLIKKNENNTI